MTHENIVYDRRVRLIEYAAKCGNVTPACQMFGVPRKTYYQWLTAASAYGTSALLPKGRRSPHQPNAMIPEEVSVLLAEAVPDPCWSLSVCCGTWQTAGSTAPPQESPRCCVGTIWEPRGSASPRLASLIAADAGQVTDAAREGPFGFYLFATHPGQVVSLDTFYVGWLKGIGAVWQLTAVDVATRTVVVQLVVGDKTAEVTAGFWDHFKKAQRKLGITLTGILSDNGPEFTGKDFATKVTAMGLVLHRIPPRSPNHNAVCERFHGTALAEFFRPHFHRGHFDDIALLDKSLQAWLVDYNERRPNNGNYMRGRTPLQVKRELTTWLRQTAA